MRELTEQELRTERLDLKVMIAEQRQEIRRLEQWKADALQVESEWDVQAVGEAIGLTIGDKIHPAILPWIFEAKAKLGDGLTDHEIHRALWLEEFERMTMETPLDPESLDHLAENSSFRFMAGLDPAFKRNDPHGVFVEPVEPRVFRREQTDTAWVVRGEKVTVSPYGERFRPSHYTLADLIADSDIAELPK